MHATGQHMYVQQFRDDVVIDTVKVEYYSFDQGGGFSTFTNGSETIKVGTRQRCTDVGHCTCNQYETYVIAAFLVD